MSSMILHDLSMVLLRFLIFIFLVLLLLLVSKSLKYEKCLLLTKRFKMFKFSNLFPCPTSFLPLLPSSFQTSFLSAVIPLPFLVTTFLPCVLGGPQPGLQSPGECDDLRSPRSDVVCTVTGSITVWCQCVTGTCLSQCLSQCHVARSRTASLALL
jgi:hypothetical protein